MLPILLSSAAVADADLSEYTRTYGTQLPSAENQKALSRCLQAWGEHPFSDLNTTPVRVIGSSVRVMGFGSGEPKDTLETGYPQLVLIRPATSVMTRTTYELTNPNGWYCLHTTTTVLGQSRVTLGCSAHLASSTNSQTIIATDESANQGGITVLGEFEITRVGCEEGR